MAKCQLRRLKVRLSGTKEKFSKLKFRPRRVKRTCFSAARRWRFSARGHQNSGYNGWLCVFVSHCVFHSQRESFKRVRVYTTKTFSQPLKCARRSFTQDSQTIFSIMFLSLILCMNGIVCVDAEEQTKPNSIWCCVAYSKACVHQLSEKLQENVQNNRHDGWQKWLKSTRFADCETNFNQWLLFCRENAFYDSSRSGSTVLWLHLHTHLMLLLFFIDSQIENCCS